MSKFIYQTDECELLLALEEHKVLSEMAYVLKRDSSVISRRLNQLAKNHQLIEKKNGHWHLTTKGMALVRWTRQAINTQALIDDQSSHKVRIATTREFASRVLIPGLSKINFKKVDIELLTSDGQSEDFLLNGRCDVAIDCGTPFHPDIRFKKVVKEQMVLISSKGYAKKNKQSPFQDYLHFERTNLLELQSRLNQKLNPKIVFNDLSSLRSAIEAGLGFGYLPLYVIKDQINLFHLYPLKSSDQLMFGVWWKKDFENRDLINHLVSFLQKQEL